VPILGGSQQRCHVVPVPQVDVDLARLQQQLDHGLMPVLSGPQQRRRAEVPIPEVDVNLARLPVGVSSSLQ